MLSSTRSLWGCNGQHVARLELQQPRSCSGGQRGWEEVGGEPGLTPRVSPTSTHFVPNGDKSHSEHKVPRWPNYARPGQTGSCKLAQRDNVSLLLICPWMPTLWHLANNNPFLLQTRILFSVTLVWFLLYISPLRLIYLLVSRDKGFHCSLAVHFTGI